MNRAVAIVQARTGSTRFPGKVLADLGGEPILALVLERLAGATLEEIVVATTVRSEDDAVADLAREQGHRVVRGPVEDVLTRVTQSADAVGLGDDDTIVRITADCPFADPSIVDRAVRTRDETGADYVSNTLLRTFPDGLDVEAVGAGTLRRAAADAKDPVEREHVTPHIQRRPATYRLRSFLHEADLGHLRWTVDTPGDLRTAAAVLDRVGSRTFTWTDGLDLTDDGSPTGRTWLRPARRSDSRVVFDLRNDPESVRWSGTGRAVDEAEHATWFRRVVDDPAHRTWLGMTDAELVGQVRVDVEEAVGTVSVVVAPDRRGRGRGRMLLAALHGLLGADHQTVRLEARIDTGNRSSRRMFAAAGYRMVRSRRPEGRWATYALDRTEAGYPSRTAAT